MIIVMETLRDAICKNFNRILDERPDIKNKQIAEAVGVHPSMIYKWRDGTNIPEPEKMEALAALFGVDVMEFYKTGSSGVISIRPSRAIKKYLVIPDNVVELASHIAPDNEVWEAIEEILKDAVEEEESRKSKGQA